MKNKFSIFILFAFLVVAVSPMSAQADGYLFVSPQRLDLNRQTKIGQLHLVNKSEKKKTYSIKIVNYKMGQNGSLEIEKAMPNSAKKFLKYSPRRVTLEPGASQYVRVMARLPKDLADGGYHSHIEFTEVENAHAKAQRQKDIAENRVSFSVSAAYGVAIPVFVENGSADAEANISGASFEKKSNREGNLKVSLNREGNTSSYNLLEMNYVSASGERTSIATPARVGVYREVDNITREFKVRLPEGKVFNGGKIEIAVFDINRDTTIGNKLNEFEISVR